ncbi:MAG: 50S ribosomal protein L3 N(5)-glutamine methyltransferase [Proteobacteria bacterium]|nr:50S ribosomal protein L3 N(5)-glutamine methyltransferase [Pseudomonadota bacterium]
MTGMSLGELIQDVAQRFDAAALSYGHGTDNAWDEAVYLVLTLTGCADDQQELARSVDVQVQQQVFELAQRRITERLPLAYLLGRCQFMGYEFELQPGVVVPRSPIGYLLEDWPDSLAPYARQDRANMRRVIDVCSGSGCLGIIAAHNFPNAQVTLLELDPIAAAIARQNVSHHQLADRVSVLEGDAQRLLADLEPGWDLIISNPPYVDAADMAALPMEYRHEPTLGLAGGDDGLALVDAMLPLVAVQLIGQGMFICEVGASEAAMRNKHASLPLIWPELYDGGEGVFLLEGSALDSHTSAP